MVTFRNGKDGKILRETPILDGKKHGFLDIFASTPMIETIQVLLSSMSSRTGYLQKSLAAYRISWVQASQPAPYLFLFELTIAATSADLLQKSAGKVQLTARPGSRVPLR